MSAPCTVIFPGVETSSSGKGASPADVGSPASQTSHPSSLTNSPSQSELSTKSNDLDEGIGESETDLLPSGSHDNSESMDTKVSDTSSSATMRSDVCAEEGLSEEHRNSTDASDATNAGPASSSVTRAPGDGSDSKEQGFLKDQAENWDLDDNRTGWDNWQGSQDEEYRRYFRGQLHINTQTGDRGKCKELSANLVKMFTKRLRVPELGRIYRSPSLIKPSYSPVNCGHIREVAFSEREK